MFYKIFLFFLILCISKNTFCQDLVYTHYSVDQGLPGSQVHDIIEDDFGYLWFSTDQGLSRYDGHSFTNYSTNDGLTDNVIFKFFKQKNGRIWCSTFNRKLFYFEGKTPKFIEYKHNSILEACADKFVINNIYVSKDETVYINFLNALGYLQIYNNGKVNTTLLESSYHQNYKAVIMIINKEYPFYYLDRSNNNYSIINSKINKYYSFSDNKIDDFHKACYINEANVAVFTNPRRILIVHPGVDTIKINVNHDPISLGKLTNKVFWVGFRFGGLALYDINGKLLGKFLTNQSVTRLFIDKEHGLWFSTLNDGVFHARSSNVKVIHHELLNNHWIHSLVFDKSGKLWLGLYDGTILTKSSNTIELNHQSKIKKPAIVFIYPTSKTVEYITDHCWYKNGNCFDIKNNPLGVYPYGIEKLLIASYSGIYTIDKDKRTDFLLGYRVNSVTGFRNAYYLGTNKGVLIMNESFTGSPQSINEIGECTVVDLESWGNILAVATRGKGLYLWNTNKVNNIGKNEGLSSDLINKIYVENDTIIWVCTNAGLNRLIKKNNNYSCFVFTKDDGLISNEITDVVTLNDTAWIATRHGLCFMPLLKNRQQKKEKINYFLTIEQVKINDDNASPSPQLDLSYFENRIKIDFKAISFLENEPLKYRYKLQGLENKWNYTTLRTAVYSSLPIGQYKFIVQVKGNNRYWKNQETSMIIIINPPFWRTWWFIISFILLIIILIYLFFRFRILSYNRDITRELLRQVLKRFTHKTNYVIFREQGNDIRISTSTINFVKADGNYIEIHTDTKKYVIRCKIGDFLELVPDKLEYLRISRSYIIRLDKVQEKSKKDVTVAGVKITVGETYIEELKKIKFKA